MEKHVLHFDIFFKTIKVFFFILTLFKAYFSTPPSTQTIKVIGLFFSFFEVALTNWAMNMYFNPISILFLGAAQTPPPQAMHRFRPPSLYSVKTYYMDILD